MREGGSRLGGGLPDVGSEEDGIGESVPRDQSEVSEKGARGAGDKRRKARGKAETEGRAHLVDGPNRSHSQLKLTLHPLRCPPCPLGRFRRESVGIRARRGEEREADGRNQVPLGKLLLVRQTSLVDVGEVMQRDLA